MFGITGRNISWIALCLPFVLSACSSAPTKDETQTTVSEAETTLKNFRNDPNMKWFRENIPKAKAVLISPDILQAGFVIGGSSGRAVAMARGDGTQGWSGPAFYRVSTGSIGFQAGAQKSEMVALVMTEKALNSLLSSSFKLGGDVSIAVGPVGEGAAAPIGADMVIYTRSKGLYGGLNLNGTAITLSDDYDNVYYGHPVTPVDILIKRSVSNPGASSLARELAATH